VCICDSDTYVCVDVIGLDMIFEKWSLHSFFKIAPQQADVAGKRKKIKKIIKYYQPR
jgi:hypothetical protein